MDLGRILVSCVWSGLFGAALAVLLTAPRGHLIATFVCAFTGRLTRDVLTGWSVGPNWSTALASAVVVLVAVAILWRHRASPVVFVSGVLPLGAAVAMFNTILELMKLSTAKGDALGPASIAFTSNLAKVFIVSLSIAVGIGMGIAIVRLVKREANVDV